MTKPPRAVREASERADQIHAEVYPEEAPPAGEPPQGPQEPAGDAPPTSSPQTPPAPESAPQAPPEAPAPPPASQQAKEDTLEFWKNKFQTLEGKYRAEVPRQASQLREYSDRVQRLEQTLANMATAPAQAPQSGANSLVSPEEVEEYGEDFVSMIRRVAQEEAGRAVQTVAPRIQEVQGELQRNRAQTAIDRVYAQLDADVKNWREINKSDEFLAWLDEEDPFAGETRKVLLRNAFDRKDGPRVLTFFTGFLDQQRTIQPQPSAQPQTPPARTQPRVSLEQLAGPRGGSSGNGAHAAEEAPIQPWTRRQIAAFYKDVQQGRYKTDPAARDRIERSINRASVNGLVTP